MGSEDPSTQRPGPSPAPAGQLSKTARDNLTKARDAYQQLLTDAEKDPKLAPSGTAVLAVKMQLGECYRELRQYPQALDTFSDILREKEASLVVQRAAALTYQERGQHEDPQWFDFAIHGGYKLKSTGQNRIWGWLRISQVAGRAARQDQKFRDAFYEARLNISRCRYLAAMKQSGDARREDLAKAKQSIQSLAQVYPDLGGERWKPEFDQLLQDIQREEGKPQATAGN
jgi:tetratricopeptide (TPR) repeat protein